MKKSFSIAFVACFIFLSAFSITEQSLWMDEATTAYFASKQSVAETISDLWLYRGSEAQMPLHVIYTNIWGSIFGVSELSLRASNLPFIALLFFSVYFFAYSNKHRALFLVIIAFHSFVIYNMNEARSTIPAFALCFSAFVVLLHLLNKTQESDQLLSKTALLLIAINFAGSVTHLFYFFSLLLQMLFVALYIFFVIEKPQRKNMTIKFGKLFSIILFGSLPALGYYMRTLIVGAGGAIQNPGLMNAAASLYELLGAGGLGPSRNAARLEMSFSSILPYLPILIPFGLSLLFFLYFSIRVMIAESRKLFLVYFFSLLIVAVIFFVFAYLFHFRFWGRHLFFLLPIIMLLCIELSSRIIQNKSLKFAFYILLLFNFLSSARIRFFNEYRKEDIKTPAIKVIEYARQGKEIYVAGNELALAYYGVFSELPQKPFNIDSLRRDYYWQNKVSAKYLSNLSTEELNTKMGAMVPGSILLFFTKYDLNDRYGSLQQRIRTQPSDTLASTSDYLIVEIK